MRGLAHSAEKSDRAGGRAESHRTGHRIRLLLRSRGARTARRRIRDHHGQLQPGNRLDRLRYFGPPLFRTTHARGRPGDRRQGKTLRGDRPVRRRSEEHTSELQSPDHLVCRLLLEKKKLVNLSVYSLSAPSKASCALEALYLIDGCGVEFTS